MAVGVGWLGILIVIAIIVAIAMAGATRRPAEDGAPHGFPWLLALLALAVVAGIVTFIVYQARPVNYVLEINVPSGKRFIGEVVVDGRPQRVEGERSGRLELSGKRISWVILIDDATSDDSIEVRLIGGASGGSSSSWGARGYSEKRFIGGGVLFTTVNEDEWQTLMAGFKQPEADANAILPGFSAPSNTVEGNDDAEDEPDTQEESPDSSDDAAPDEADESETPPSTES